jgi:hypothetical protein
MSRTPYWRPIHFIMLTHAIKKGAVSHNQKPGSNLFNANSVKGLLPLGNLNQNADTVPAKPNRLFGRSLTFSLFL